MKKKLYKTQQYDLPLLIIIIIIIIIFIYFLKASETFFNQNVFHDLSKMYFNTTLLALKIQSHQQLTNA